MGTAFTFTKATKAESRLRLALMGPSGSGKTYTALAIATHLAGGGRVAVIDSERGSASKYSDRFDFDVLNLETFEPETYVAALGAAVDAGYAAVVIDSLSHAWMGKGGALEQVDRAQARSQSRNSFDAWRTVTPKHNALVDAMLRAGAHLIVTMRVKTDYAMEEDSRGKKVPRRIGLAPVQRDGLEYEFDVVADIDLEHRFVVSKTRCPELTDKVFERAGADVAKILAGWLAGTPRVEPAPQRAPQTQTERREEPAPASQPPAEMHGTLAAFLGQVAALKLPGDAAKLWVKFRAELAVLPAGDRRRAWTDLVKRVESVGKMKGADTWLKKMVDELGRTDPPPDDGPRGGGRPAPDAAPADAHGESYDSDLGADARPVNLARARASRFAAHIAAKPRVHVPARTQAEQKAHTRSLSEIAHSYLKRRQEFLNAGCIDECLDVVRVELLTRGCDDPDALLQGVAEHMEYGTPMPQRPALAAGGSR